MAHDEAGLHLDDTQAQLVQHRLEPLADQTHRSSVSSLVSQVMESDDQALRSHILEALIPTDTRFFRDACCMEALRADILPRLIRIRSSARSLRIWSAAASSGQEIYSILMMLHDDFPETLDWNIQAWATDLNPRAVKRIEEGVYSRCEAKRGLSSDQISAHFLEHGGNLQILPAHRDHVHTNVMNLVKEWPDLPTFDLILNRNVMHTFDAPTRVSLLQRTHDQLRHPSYKKPELLATGPGQLWSWDITKLKGPKKWSYFHLYVIIDVFSRYVVGWMVAEEESAALAKRFLAETIGKEMDDASELTVHADRGTSMRSKMVAHLLADLGVTKTHSRPYTSNDNAFSESQFKTMKYRPGFPKSFGALEDARAFCRPFFRWYNHEHHHHGLALLTPADVHLGRADTVLDRRQEALDRAYAAHPERFSKPPVVSRLAREVWINPPSRKAAEGAPAQEEATTEGAPGSIHVEATAGAPADSAPSPEASPGSEDRRLPPSHKHQRVTNFSEPVSHSC